MFQPKLGHTQIEMMVHKNKRIRRENCSGQAVAVHGPLVFILYSSIFIKKERAISVKLSQLGGDASPIINTTKQARAILDC